MKLFNHKIPKEKLELAAWASGSVAMLIAVAVFVGSGSLNLSNNKAQTAATALGDAQGVPAGYTGQTYPAPTWCYDDTDSNPNRHDRFSIPSCSAGGSVVTAILSAHLQGVNTGRTGILVKNGAPSYTGTAVDGKPGDSTSIEWSCLPSQQITFTQCHFGASGGCMDSYEVYYTNYYASNSTGTGFSTGGALNGSTVVPFPATNTTYTMQCGAQTPLSITLGKVPTLSISADPQSVDYNGSTTLTWTTTNAPVGTACTVTGNGVSATGINDSKDTPALKANATYTMTCTSGFGTQTATTNVVVGPRPAPELSITATPSIVTTGNNTTIDWYAKNADSCTVSGPGVYATTLTGSKQTSALSVNSTYVLTCATGNHAMPTQSTSVTVPVVAPVCVSAPGTPGVCSFSALPAVVLQGGTSTITWNCPSSNNSSSSGTNFSTGGAITGTKTVNPLVTTTYSILCSASGGKGTAIVTVTQPKITIIATPQRVRKGTTTSLQWTSVGVTAGSCSIKNTAGTVLTSDNGSKTITVPQADIYTLTCSTPAASLSASVNVVIIPEFQEQ